jgi:hypothetical protein
VTTNLGAPQVANNQDQKEQTINDAIGRLDGAITDVLGCSIDATNTLTVSDDDFKSHAQFDCVGAGVTAAFTLIVPSVRKGLFVVSNEAGYTATVEISGQALSAPTVADSAIGLFFCDGTNVRAV